MYYCICQLLLFVDWWNFWAFVSPLPLCNGDVELDWGKIKLFVSLHFFWVTASFYSSTSLLSGSWYFFGCCCAHFPFDLVWKKLRAFLFVTYFSSCGAAAYSNRHLYEWEPLRRLMCCFRCYNSWCFFCLTPQPSY